MEVFQGESKDLCSGPENNAAAVESDSLEIESFFATELMLRVE